MKATSIFVDNREFSLGRRIGKGGEGEVYLAASEAGLAVKLYTVSDKANRERKIVTMIRAGRAQKSPLTAFPISLVRQRNGEFVGFTMRLVPEHMPLHDLYSPGSRKHKFPSADFRFLVRSAANIARAIASVHHAGCVIGDINHSSILISKKATVALIDADSFQVSDGTERFYCLVGVPEYTPPELQGMRLSGVVRTANHDAFGLAIVIFQLLFMGRHPFVGSVRKGDIPPIQDAIRDYRFVYSEGRDVGMDQPPGTPVLSDFSADIAQAFERAFERENALARPSAMDWVRTLDALEKSLVQCEKNKLHYVPDNAASCPWCDMEERLGTVLFLPYLPEAIFVTHPIDLDSGGFDVEAVWAKINSVVDAATLQTTTPRLTSVSVTPSPELGLSKNKFSVMFWARVIAVAVAAIVLFAASDLWLIWLPLGLFAAFAGKGKTRQQVDSTRHSARYVELEKRWQTEIAKWRVRSGVDDLAALHASLETAKNEYKELHAEEKRRVEHYRSGRKAQQRHAFLDGFLIRNAKIKGIGPAKLATLASFGIESAADISMEKLQGVPGFGPVNSGNLLGWRSKIEGRFVYREQPTETDRRELLRINREMQSKGAQLRRLLIPGAENLSRLVARLRAASEMEDPMLNRLHHELEQAKCNLQFLGVALPHIGSLASARIPAASRPQAVTPNVVTYTPHCPRCGSAMVRRTASRGPNAGRGFWGCLRFPQCRGTRN
jgi:DNA-binding helix-hairpin-helix protein with protein kinase domain